MTTSLSNTEFESTLRSEGYLDIETKSYAPNIAIGEHRHNFDVWARVLEGEAEIACNGVPVTYRAGDSFKLAAGTPHTEKYGPQGYTFLVGRRHIGK